ncbi:hypothetical protein GUJ93_ZPchr0006g46298 [Zizania palustris]|uniref:Uncharacterized protein n=1 Tax=Zizania palustris TaxID=103762 RepID=A0A8J5T950_ZIZPA|nr:hypothetical protein GUJ93_ZPchr0006g46298 [Zizania palustris]
MVTVERRRSARRMENRRGGGGAHRKEGRKRGELGRCGLARARREKEDAGRLGPNSKAGREKRRKEKKCFPIKINYELMFDLRNTSWKILKKINKNYLSYFEA